MSTLIEKIEALKMENKMVCEENIVLKAEVASLTDQRVQLKELLTVTSTSFNGALEQLRIAFVELLAKQTAETKCLIDNSQANENVILENYNNALDVFKDLQVKYDRLQTDYNQYIKGHL